MCGMRDSTAVCVEPTPKTTFGSVGDLAIASLETFRDDHTFIATDGLSVDSGLTFQRSRGGRGQSMIAAGADVTPITDGSNCGRAPMVSVAPLAALDRVIT